MDTLSFILNRHLRLLSFFTLLFFCHAISPAYSQTAPPIQWQKILGGTSDDLPNMMKPTADGGFAVFGTTFSNNFDVTANNGISDFWMTKLDPTGNIQWQKSYGGTAIEVARAFDKTSDGGYILTGHTSSKDRDLTENKGFLDYWIVKINAISAIQCQRSIPGSGHDDPLCIVQTADGGYLVGGSSSSNDLDVGGNHGGADAWLAKLDPAGNIQWQKSYGGSLHDYFYRIVIADNGYLLVGNTNSTNQDIVGNHGQHDVLLIKIALDGTIQWQKCFGGTGMDFSRCIAPTSDGGYIVGASSDSNDGDVTGNHGKLDAWIFKIDNTGRLLWQKSFGGSEDEWSVDIQQTADNGFVIGSITTSNNGNITGHHGARDYWTFKLDALGNLQWQKCMGGSRDDFQTAVLQTSDGWFVAAGYTSSPDGDVIGLRGMTADFWLVKIAPDPRCIPTISISPSANPICMGTSVTFNATIARGSNPVYRWKKNGVIESNGNTYTSYFRNGDVITCEMTSRTACGKDTTVISNSVAINVLNDVMPEVTISASETVICPGTPVNFASVSFYGTMTPSYQWQVDGQNVGTNSTTFSTANLKNQSIVQCIMTISSPVCIGTTKDYSNPITITVNPMVTPQLTISADNLLICKGGSAKFTATPIHGGASPAYQWKVNGITVGTNNTTFTSGDLKDGDIVSCVMTLPGTTCQPITSTVSNELIVKVFDVVIPSISISAEDNLCEGMPVIFTSSTTNAGNLPTLQWQVNDINVGNNNGFILANPIAGDKVQCILKTNNAGCQLTVFSNIISVAVKQRPKINFADPVITLSPGQQLQLNPIVTGNIKSFNWAPVEMLTNPNILTPLTKGLNSHVTFKLAVTGENDCASSAEVTVKVFRKLAMPNAFTPNGDGKNDSFGLPDGVQFELKEFSIFNRWGNKIFTTADIRKAWDGRLNGVKSDAGTYVYFVRGTDQNGEVIMKGSFILIR